MSFAHTPVGIPAIPCWAVLKTREIFVEQYYENDVRRSLRSRPREKCPSPLPRKMSIAPEGKCPSLTLLWEHWSLTVLKHYEYWSHSITEIMWDAPY